jgi:tRNA(His) guanylyltransferase
MKECEIFSNLRIPCGSKIVIRADGRNFSRLAADLEFEKPYDQDFVEIMVATCHDFFHEFSPRFIYTFSDEINILLDEIPFQGRIEKMNSIFASFITGALTRQILANKRFSHTYDNIKSFKPISFDSRVIPLDYKGIVAYFKGRQDEAWRNCLNGHAYWTLRKEFSKQKAAAILDKKKSQQIHEILFNRKINISEMPSWHRRGVGIYRQKITAEGYNPIKKEKVNSIRWKPFTNWELPLLNPEFFDKLDLKDKIIYKKNFNTI